MRNSRQAMAAAVLGIGTLAVSGAGHALAQGGLRPVDTGATRLSPAPGGGAIIDGLGPVFRVPVSVSALDPALRSIVVRCEATSADTTFAGYGRLALNSGGATGFVTIQTHRTQGNGAANGGVYTCLLMASTDATGDIPASTEMVANSAPLLPTDYRPPAAGSACEGSVSPYCGLSDFLSPGGTTRIGVGSATPDAKYKVDPAGYSGLVQGTF